MISPSQKQMLNSIAQAIYDKKGFNILGIDVHQFSTLTDSFIIAEGNVERHVQALSRSVQDILKDFDLSPIQIEGERAGDWVVLDYGDVVIHILTHDMREKYALETLWKEGKIVDFDLKLNPTTEWSQYEE